MKILLCTLALFVTVSGTGLKSCCVQDSCNGLTDGNYHSCTDCHHFVTCSAGNFDDVSCPGTRQWDSTSGACVARSTTCDSCDYGPKQEGDLKPVPVGTCLNDCKGVVDGDYQHCKSCTQYMTCVGGLTYKDRPCPHSLRWDDAKKLCHYTSQTCDEPGTPGCITSCSGRNDGNYASCHSCEYYATCVRGYLSDDRPCPPGLFWDDSAKVCSYDRAACDDDESGGPEAEPVAAGSVVSKPGSCCITSCAGLLDGNYPSCRGCDYYATCHAGALKERPCPYPRKWDNLSKTCSKSSTTC